MPFFSRHPVRRRRDGSYEIALSTNERDLLRHYLEQLRELLLSDDPLLRRMFPPAYLTDPDQDREYQELMRGDLLESHFAAIEAVEGSLDATALDEAQLTRWMQAINALRLVIGTRLDISEDDTLDLDPDDEDFELRFVYYQLQWLFAFIVDALRTSLPEPAPDIEL